MQIKSKASLFIIALYFGLTSCSAFQTSSSFILDSGMRVIVSKNPPSQRGNNAELRLVVRAGSLQEEDSERGYAHFVEHMAFNSTRNYPKESLIPTLEGLGMSLGRHSNAETRFDSTIYSLSLDNLTDEKLETAVDILAQWAMHIQFEQETIAAEIPVIREEWRLRQPQKNHWQTERLKAMFNGSRYAERLPIGTLDSIESVRAEDLEAFYQRWYRPQNMALIATGDVDPRQIHKLTDRFFGNWTQEKSELPSVHNLSIQAIPQVQTVTDARIDGSRVSLEHYTVDQWPQTEDELFNAFLWQGALRILEQRLDARLLNTKGAVSDISINWSRPSPEVLNIGVNATLPGNQIETAILLLIEDQGRLLQHGVTIKELNRWRNEVLSNQRLRRVTAAYRASAATNHFLYGVPLLEQAEWLELLEKRLPAITTDSINTAVRRVLIGRQHLAVIASPTLPTPDSQSLERWLTEQTKSSYEATTPGKNLSDWSINPVLQGEIIKTRQRPNKVTEWHLGNGITVLYHFSQAIPGKVHYQLSSEGGMNQLTQQESIYARLALESMAASGLRNYTAAELSQWLSSQGIEQYPEYQFFDRGIKGSGPAEHFGSMMELLHISLTEARVLPNVWEHVLEKNKQQLAQFEHSNQKLWRKKIDELIFRQDAALRVMTAAELEAVQPENLIDLYRNHYAGAQNYQLAIVGDIGKYEARRIVLKTIATLPPSKSDQSNNIRTFPRLNKPVNIQVTGSGEKAALVIRKFQLPKSQLPNLNYDQLHFLTVWLYQKMMNEVREKHGLAYTIGSLIEGKERGWRDFTLTLQLACDPEKVEQVNSVINETLQSMVEQQPSSEQVAVWEKTRQTELKHALNSPGFLAATLATAPVLGKNINQIGDAKRRGTAPESAALSEALAVFIGPASIPATLVWMP